MKFRIEFEGDFYEERDMLKLISNASELSSCISEAQSMVRARIKWAEGVSEEEDKFLRDLLTELSPEFID